MPVNVPLPGRGATMLLITTGLTCLPVIGDVTVEVMRMYEPSLGATAQLISSPVLSVTHLASDLIV